MMTNMLIIMRLKTTFYFLLTFWPVLLTFSPSTRAETNLAILVTSNLQGMFSLEVRNQEVDDPLLVLGQNIVAEREKGIDLYLDMGNALYPGILSKYSSGSTMMDFLNNFYCEAVLVSSKDLQIGMKNIEFLQKTKQVRLLSSNIVQEKNPIFTPWFAIDRAGTRIAFLGLSSEKIRFDIAEENLYGYSLIEAKESLEAALKDIHAAGINHIILLSGQNLRDTTKILETFPEIGMALCGGDASSRFFGGKASRVDLTDGRSIIMTDDSADYHLLKLAVGEVIKVQSLEPRKAAPIPTNNYKYKEFKNRLTLWKENFIESENRLVASLKATEYEINDQRLTHLLRDRFDCELAAVEQDTINPLPLTQDLKQSDFLGMVNRDYNILIFDLSGDELRIVQQKNESLVISGMVSDEDLRVQGVPVSSFRPYRVAASQPAMQSISRMLRKKIGYRNTWMTVSDILVDDLKDKRVLLRKDYDYLDRRRRTTIDAYLSNFIDNSSVERDDDVKTPPGQPSKSYNKWGLENRIDITHYNKYHRFVFTPYMLYSRQDDDYLNNLLRGTLVYDYSLSETLKPYNKLLCETVVEEVDGLRPILIRETLGISGEYKKVFGKLGLGFEKEVQDPASGALYGIELILGARIPFLSHFTYAFDLDTFSGIRSQNGQQQQIRSEINNAISVELNEHLSMSFRHKFFYRYEDLAGEKYQNSQFITSLDLKNDWKFW